MRKSLLLLFITLSTITYGQSLMVVEQDTIVEINSTSVSDYGFHIKVKNTSSEDLDVMYVVPMPIRLVHTTVVIFVGIIVTVRMLIIQLVQ